MNNKNGMILWSDALNPVNDFRREFDRLFDDWLTPSIHGLRTASRFVPACEVEEQDEHYLLAIEMPGVKKEDIKMEAIDQQMVVSGERRNEKFQRTFALPAGIDVGKIEANYQDGILEIVIPKAESAKPRQIKISSGIGGSKFFGRFLGQSPKKLEEKEEQRPLPHSDKAAS